MGKLRRPPFSSSLSLTFSPLSLSWAHQCRNNHEISPQTYQNHHHYHGIRKNIDHDQLQWWWRWNNTETITKLLCRLFWRRAQRVSDTLRDDPCNNNLASHLMLPFSPLFNTAGALVAATAKGYDLSIRPTRSYPPYGWQRLLCAIFLKRCSYLAIYVGHRHMCHCVSNVSSLFGGATFISDFVLLLSWFHHYP